MPGTYQRYRIREHAPFVVLVYFQMWKHFCRHLYLLTLAPWEAVYTAQGAKTSTANATVTDVTVK